MRWHTQDPWQWHRWFAWRPVPIAEHEWLWLALVERRRNIHLYNGAKRFWEYRLPITKEKQ